MPRALFLTASALLLLAGCIDRTPISAEFRDPVSGISIKYALRQGHEFLAEFDRGFHIAFAHGEKDVPLAYDSGGYVLMSIYRIRDGTLVFFDREGYVIVDPMRETVRQAEQIDNAAGSDFLGCFDWYGNGKDRTLQFIPPSVRGDRYGLGKH
jgi:hypothetical protein